MLFLRPTRGHGGRYRVKPTETTVPHEGRSKYYSYVPPEDTEGVIGFKVCVCVCVCVCVNEKQDILYRRSGEEQMTGVIGRAEIQSREYYCI